jgi:hypothetical protein
MRNQSAHREETMKIATKIGRRHLAIAGAAALGTVSLLRDAPALAADDPSLAQAVEDLRKAILSADKAKLTALTASDLSYGHSSAVVQDQPTFIDGVVNRKATVKTLEFPELKMFVAGDAGVTRQHVDIGVLGVWQKQGGAWKLLARQGYKLA